MQEMVRFMKVDAAFINTRPLRYCAMFDSYQNSLPYVARYHAKKVLKLRDALLMSYHRNEVRGIHNYIAAWSETCMLDCLTGGRTLTLQLISLIHGYIISG